MIGPFPDEVSHWISGLENWVITTDTSLIRGKPRNRYGVGMICNVNFIVHAIAVILVIFSLSCEYNKLYCLDLGDN